MKKHGTFKALALTLLLCSSLAVAACSNTMYGAGKDIENAGETVKDASK